MKYTTIFFDRDNTLTHGNPLNKEFLHSHIELWSGKPLDMSYEKMLDLFYQVSGTKKPWLKSVEKGIKFYKKYYYYLLKGEGITQHLTERAQILFKRLWNNNHVAFPETETVLKKLKQKGYSLGVISDTFPSLKLSLEKIGLAKYFSSFTCSSEVMAYKPDPKIFTAALTKHNAKASECIYIDDYDIEADGARKLGFTSFLIDRSKTRTGEWIVSSLSEVLDFF